MTVYQLYVLDSESKLMGSAIRVDLPNDRSAINRAEQERGGHSVELWQDDRGIGRFDTERLPFLPRKA